MNRHRYASINVRGLASMTTIVISKCFPDFQ